MKTQRYTYDYIAGTDIHLWQRSDMFRINTDTAQLAHFMKVRAGERVLDIGTNNGALLLCAEQFSPSFLCGVDIQANACQLAERNLKEHGISHAQILCGDFCEMDLQGFDVIVCNPPFFPMGHHGEVTATPRSIARHELFLPLDRLLSGAARALKENGRLGHFCLTQILVGAVEHDVRNAVPQDVISLFKQFLGQSRVFIQVLAHPYELGALSGKYKCFHNASIYNRC